MSRIRKAYEAKFRALLLRAGTRRLQQGQVWLAEYFRCQGCGQLFWHGTHWKDIQEKLSSTSLSLLLHEMGGRANLVASCR